VANGKADVTENVQPVRFIEGDQPAKPKPGMALCLSGGGYRAMLFHVGALMRLNQMGLLRTVVRVSSVSGGSIAAAMLGLIQSGKIKILAITSSKRVAIAPDVPTVTEAGFPFLGMDSLIGIYGPRGMSNALRDKIAADVQAVIAADPTIAQRLAATAQIVDIRGPAEFATGIKEMRDQLADIAKVLGIKAAQQAQ